MNVLKINLSEKIVEEFVTFMKDLKLPDFSLLIFYFGILKIKVSL